MGSRQMKLGFIGSGKMATALAQGVIKSGVCPVSDILVSDAIPAAAQKLAAATGARHASSNAEVLRECDAVVLAVKPYDAISALTALPSDKPAGKLLLSIVAGLICENGDGASTVLLRRKTERRNSKMVLSLITPGRWVECSSPATKTSSLRRTVASNEVNPSPE